ncbi:MAG: glycosyltransferase family 2 protein [Bacteroidetes bacterium]|nr:glycosyltransferase family 2 protein [Bacteroidota bacterium]
MPNYFQKHAFTERLIEDDPVSELKIVVVIPCFNEASLLPVFRSLNACNKPKSKFEVIAIINAGEHVDERIKHTNQICFQEALSWINAQRLENYHVFNFPSLPKKHAGVGLARKIGMDEAARRLPAEGIIINLDADCTVAENYFVAIEAHFRNSNCDAASIYFEHPIHGESVEIQNAIIDYELYLRYFINMQKLIGFPWAYQTIGSAMAVCNKVYLQQGGMNRRKAGEDFYFLQKIIELGNFSELNETTVFASPRQSDRVPFGTGKAVNQIIEDGNYTAYNPHTFNQLADFFTEVDSLFGLSESGISAFVNKQSFALKQFLVEWTFTNKVLEIQKATSGKAAFRKRIFRAFNAFQLMKFCHFARDNGYPNVSIETAVNHLFKKLELAPDKNKLENLYTLRAFDKRTM